MVKTTLIVCRTVWLAVVTVLAVDLGQGAPIPKDFDKNVVQFIFTMSGTNPVPIGTCFFVDLAVTHRHTGFRGLINWHTRLHHMRYIVTAKHVLFDDNGKVRTNLYLRVADRKGNAELSLIDSWLTNKFRVLTHPDKSVDLAVISVGWAALTNSANVTDKDRLAEGWKVACLDAGVIADRKSVRKRHVREGDDMFFVGLFTPFYGSHENIPICRFGRLAMMTEEKVPWGKEGDQNLYLMETGAFGGNSGSPAFFSFVKSRSPPLISFVDPSSGKPLSKSILLAGVVKGYFRDWSEVMMMNATPKPFSSENVGVAAIVPAYQLQEILFSPEEIKFRSDVWKAHYPRGYK